MKFPSLGLIRDLKGTPPQQRVFRAITEKIPARQTPTPQSSARSVVKFPPPNALDEVDEQVRRRIAANAR